jgi:alanine-glyoxylate transaminase/serine-glyoxylate transaminase/serine-pyruvate transaminase
MLRMTIGPTRIAPSVLSRVAVAPPAINDPEFLQVFAGCLRDTRAIHGIAKGLGYILPATGTMGMEMLAANFTPPGSHVVVFSTGFWGDRWAESCRRIGLVVHRVPVNARGPIDYAAVADMLKNNDIKAVLATHVDSSSGLVIDPGALGVLAREHGALLLVDGICGAGCETMEQDKWGVDVLLSSTPKAIGVPCGLIMITTSDRATEQLKSRSWDPGTLALDLKPWVSVMEAHSIGQFGYFQSPAGNLMAGLAEGYRLILAEGLGARVERHQRLTRELHAGLERLGLEILVKEASYRANGVTVILYPEGRDSSFLQVLFANGLVLPGGTHSEYGPRTFRIGHFGNVTDDDITTTLSVLEKSLKQTARAAA